MNKNTIAIALVVAVVSAQGNSENAYGRDPDFREWVAQNNKSFSSREDMEKREKNFRASAQKVANLRRKYPETQFALNIYSDLDEDEWDAMRGMDESKLGDRRLQAQTGSGRHLQSAAPSINWLNSGHMGAVKNQGQCGSCWAFNSTSVLEAKKSIKDSAAGGSLVPPVRLSEQEAVDCSTSYGNLGCSGGWPSNYWSYARDNGAVSSIDYPYETKDMECTRDTVNFDIETTVQTWNYVGMNDQVIANALQEGPLSVAVQVEGDGWKYYAGGVMPVDGCTTNQVNHALVLVGYEAGQQSITPGEDIWVPPTDDVWVPGTPDEFVPATEDYCRPSKRRERRRNRCNGGVAILSVDETECCIPGEEAYTIPGTPGYWESGEEGYWMPGEDTVVTVGRNWIFQNSWGPGWGDNGMITIPVEVGNGPGHCNVQKYVQNVVAV